MIHVLDDALPNIEAYRKKALELQFRSYEFEHCTFHGIAVGELSAVLLKRITGLFPNLAPTLTFFRKSPEGQEEPHYIHTDVDMGQWSAILYLNENPPEGDGTSFWKYKSGEIGSEVPHERSIEGKNPDDWELLLTVPARMNRLVMFPSSRFHSRAIHGNWGSGEDARLTQVAFGTGQLVQGSLS